MTSMVNLGDSYRKWLLNIPNQWDIEKGWEEEFVTSYD